MDLRVLFMGTPSFAAIILDALLAADILPGLVITAPDRPGGRGRKLRTSAVKDLAVRAELELFQPEDVNAAESVERIRQYRPDVVALAAFGAILSPEVLVVPPLGPLNVHPSLLPEYRGPAPIQWALLDGRDITGVSIFKMNPRIDRGEILMQKRVRIEPEHGFSELHNILAATGAELLIEVLRRLDAGEELTPRRQEGKGSYRKKFKKKNGRMKWAKSARKCHNRVRALNPWPGTFSFLNGRRLRIWKTAVGDAAAPPEADPGTILDASEGAGITVACGDGVLVLREVQLEGKKRMTAGDFLRGCRLSAGDVLE